MFLGPNGICNHCEDLALKARRAEIAEINRRAYLQDRLGEMLGERGADNYYFEKFRSAPGTAEAFKAAKSFDPKKDNLFLFGNSGVGKSHLAGAVVRDALSRGIEAYFATSPVLMRRFQGCDQDEYHLHLDSYANIPIFVLDELGIGRATEFVNQVLYEIISLREKNYQNGMIITCNFGLSAAAEKMGDNRLTSRINGMCRRILMDDVDHRRPPETK